MLAPLLGTGIFTRTGLQWEKSRDSTHRRITEFKAVQQRVFEKHLSRLVTRLPKEGTFDLQPFLLALTLDIMMELLECDHHRPSTKDGDPYDDFVRSFDIAQAGLAKRLRLGFWYFLYSPPQFWKACAQVQSYVAERILISPAKNTILGDASVDRCDRDEATNLIFAGRDTTASCISWTV
jgi:cytochrome P450